MNYRHAFHAGNVADVLKHVLLARMLHYLVQKPAPLRFIDTHAGLGRYNLAGPEALRTGEWRQGIARVLKASRPEPVADLLAPYLRTVGPFDAEGRPDSYPGSPAIARELLRPADRILLCELHPADAATLGSTTKRDRRVKVLAVDGYQGLKAAVPPPERRGLVLVDPPYEDRAEFDHLATGFAEAYRRWPTGIYALWYPLKAGTPAAPFLQGLRAHGLPKILEAELFANPSSEDAGGLRGSGLFVVNPTYGLEADMRQLLPFLADCFAVGGSRWRWRLGEMTG